MTHIGRRLLQRRNSIGLRGRRPPQTLVREDDHIQWVRFRRALISPRAASNTPACALTKRSRSTGHLPQSGLRRRDAGRGEMRRDNDQQRRLGGEAWVEECVRSTPISAERKPRFFLLVVARLRFGDVWRAMTMIVPHPTTIATEIAGRLCMATWQIENGQLAVRSPYGSWQAPLRAGTDEPSLAREILEEKLREVSDARVLDS